MNTVVTSKEAILTMSRELIREQGWDAVNIRTVAKACDISVGTIYNYFHNKADLVAATVESVWADIFHVSDMEMVLGSFLDCVEWIFDCIREGNEKYPGFFSMHSVSFLNIDKADGQKRMANSWHHIKQGLFRVLMSDQAVKKECFDERFAPDDFIEIIFSLILSALVQQKYDCEGIKVMVKKMLYE